MQTLWRPIQPSDRCLRFAACNGLCRPWRASYPYTYYSEHRPCGRWGSCPRLLCLMTAQFTYTRVLRTGCITPEESPDNDTKRRCTVQSSPNYLQPFCFVRLSVLSISPLSRGSLPAMRVVCAWTTWSSCNSTPPKSIRTAPPKPSPYTHHSSSAQMSCSGTAPRVVPRARQIDFWVGKAREVKSVSAPAFHKGR